MPRVQTCTAATVAGPVAGSPSLSGVPLCRRPCDTALRTARLLCSASWAGRRRRGGKSALVILPPLFRRSFSLSFLRSAVHSLYVRCCPCHLQWEALWGNHKRGVGGVRGGEDLFFLSIKEGREQSRRTLLPPSSPPHQPASRRLADWTGAAVARETEYEGHGAEGGEWTACTHMQVYGEHGPVTRLPAPTQSHRWRGGQPAAAGAQPRDAGSLTHCPTWRCPQE